MLLKIPIKGIEKKFDVKILSIHFAFSERVRHKIEEGRQKEREKKKEWFARDPLSTWPIGEESSPR